MASNKYYDPDDIPELSPHRLGVYDEDQLEKDKPETNSMIELELARLRITQLEKLRRQGSEGFGRSINNSEDVILKNLYLPKREILRFDGTPINYWNFIRNFEECIGCGNIGFRAKLNYLIQYCDGEAKAAILHCAILEPEIGYHQALKLLEETFGQKHIIARTFIDNLLNFPNIKRNQPVGLRKLSREMQACCLTLEQMNYVSDLNSTRTIEAMVLKLPTHVQQKWLKTAYKIIRGGREPLFADLTAFVKEQADMANTRYGLLVNRGSNSDNRDVGVLKGRISSDYNAARISYASINDDNVPSLSSFCLECSGNHSIDQCQKFQDKNVRERKEFVLRHKLCNVCLKANHVAKNCRSPRSCVVEGCSWRHHTLLHEKQEEQRDSNSDVYINTQFCTEGSVKRMHRPVAFEVVPVWLKNGEKIIQTCALLDSGSDASLIVDDLAKELSLEGKPKTVSLKTIDNESSLISKEVDVELHSIDFSSSVKVQKVLTVKKLPSVHRTVLTANQMATWSHLKDISFPRVKNAKVKLLIGCNVPNVHEMKEIKTGNTNEPSAVRTLLGWTLFGPYGELHGKKRVLNYLSDKEELEDKFEQLYSTEFKDPFSCTTPMAVEDRIALSAISNSVQRLSWHYQIALPWRHEHKLPNNKKLAERRLSCLKGRLIRDTKFLQDYTSTMTQYIERDYAEKVNDNHVDGRIWYLSHHPVFHPKKPNKLRIVFDCASQYAGTSLNKNFYSGPDLVNNLVDVFTRFQQRPISRTADIEAMFHQVVVPMHDRDALRYLWWPGGDLEKKSEIYRMKVYLFGATSLPCSVTFALQKTISDNLDKFPRVVTQLAKGQFYVDDLLISMDAIEEAKLTYSHLKGLISLGGYNLTKWTSNNIEVLEFDPEEDRTEGNVTVCESNGTSKRTLGIEWNIRTEESCFKVREYHGNLTRRNILSYVASIRDPVGLIASIILPAKMTLSAEIRPGRKVTHRLSSEVEHLA
ncbi:unnamed protein product [Schistosoma rodhaini]|uniref:Reverse transcriptase domain-containing protein n=1 Tax=Schistosoma rodhaini TaxID=6188 RepID=A0AA85G9E1_9TREM|nr:unnamed protein product [Schistosoma rodhaini]